MMHRRDIIAGIELEWMPPPTLADVLDWRVWCQCIETDDPTEQLAQQAAAGFEWAARWLVDFDADEIAEAISEAVEPAEVIPTLVRICEAIAASAELPASVIDAMRQHLDRENEVPPDWKATGACTCARCRRGIENPQGVVCMYDAADWRAMRALISLSGVEDTTQRPYIAQVRAVMTHAESRRLRYEREQREERAEYMDALKRKGVIRG